MGLFAKIIDLFRVPGDKPELAASQLRAFSAQVPLLYLILLSNGLFLSATHYGVAPDSLTVYVPSVLGVVCVTRLFMWLRRRNRIVDHQNAIRQLKSTVILTSVIGAGFTAWGLSLHPYGTAYLQMHVVFFMATTMIGVVFCLMHVRAAAFAATLVVIPPFALYFGLQDNPVLTAVSANTALVCVAMLYIVSTHYRDYAKMVEQQSELSRKNAETQRLSDENLNLANRDSLTGLPNRRSFLASIETLLPSTRGDIDGLVVGLVDLDGFKTVNDLYGHAAGDRLLQEASRRMLDLAGWDVQFSRLGGDEFGIVLRGSAEPHEITEFGNALCDSLKLPYALGGLRTEISASVGFAVFPDSGTTVDSLVESADYALYQAKEQAAGSAVIFNSEHAITIKRLNLIDQALRTARLETECSLEYQPIVNPRTGHVMCYEALARWRNKALGEISPDIFIKAAERSDLINRLALILFRKALDDMASWPPQLRLSFNLSVRNIASPECILEMTAEMMKRKIDPRRIVFEVTETAVMADFDQALETLSSLRSIGARIALDDFGTGYSSLSYVHRLPLDKIKIDRRFIADIESNMLVRNIVKSIVDLSRNLGLACVVEGIETEAQASIVAELGCNLAQGYLYGRPEPACKIAQQWTAISA